MGVHEDFMREAVRVGLEAMRDGSGEPFGAVVARGDEFVAAAANQAHALGTPTAHAELMAINAACRKLGLSRLDGFTVYASGQPCLMCLAAMLVTGVGVLYYANTHADIGYDPTPEIRAACGVYGAAGADPGTFASAPGIEIRRLPVPEAEALIRR